MMVLKAYPVLFFVLVNEKCQMLYPSEVLTLSENKKLGCLLVSNKVFVDMNTVRLMTNDERAALPDDPARVRVISGHEHTESGEIYLGNYSKASAYGLHWLTKRFLPIVEGEFVEVFVSEEEIFPGSTPRQ